MKNKKRNTIVTCVIVGVILLAGFIFYFLNHSVIDNGLSVLEKKWISDHANKVVDIQVYNDVPVYGYNGSGVNFDFLDYFMEKYGVSFNRISYYTLDNHNQIDFGFKLLKPNAKIGDQDILFDVDHYVVLSLDGEVISSLDHIDKVGILKSDSEILKGYFKDIVEYKNLASLMKGISNKEVSYVSVPVLQCMNQILENKLQVVYHIEDLKNQYVLSVSDPTVYEIMKKTYADYVKKDYIEDYSKNYLFLYFNSIGANDVSRKNYNSKIYRYGYVVNMPFENVLDEDFVGTISNYLTRFEDVSFSEIDAIKYDSIDDLKSALVSGEVDFALTNFDYEKINLKYVTSSPIRDVNYYVLSKNDIVINSIKGLIGKKVSVVSGSLLDKLCSDNGVEVNSFSDTDALLRSLDDDSIALIDEETYRYYKDSKLKDYYVVLSDRILNGYRFIMNESNSTFNMLFQYFVNSTDYNSFMYQYHTNVNLDGDYTMLKVFAFIVGLILFLTFTVVILNRKNVVKAVAKKEDRLKYIDPMTSLKNRSYLNSNIYTWDDNVIFPQGIIVLDLDHIKRVNDKFGREAGDDIIKKAAGILINQQLENTDIIRSDGDEFIIYMVGYDEKQVKEYMGKLKRLIRDIPKCLGVEAGYSMIFDEVKTVDDAINEAIEMMMKGKEIK